MAGELQKSILLAAGYEAEIAHDGAEAFEMLLQKAWDLVDRRRGHAATGRLRADGPACGPMSVFATFRSIIVTGTRFD